MKIKFTHFLAISTILFLGSCATSNQTAQQIDQNDDVYYSEAQAREKAEVIAQAQPETAPKSDYVTDDELYRDAYGNSYYGEYADRISRFRNYAPWRGYYNNFYSFYDPFYNPYSFYGGPGINVSIGVGTGFGYFNNYNPWRYYGSNYNNNFWGPYSYYNNWNLYGVGYGMGYGGGFYGNNGFYGNGYYRNAYGGGRPVYTSPNYRPRPTRSGDGLPIDPGAVNGAGRGVITNGNGNGNIIQSTRPRAERYNDGNATRPSSGNTRPQATAPRPERVQQAQPQRAPERVNSAPPPSNNNSGGSRSSGGNSGGSSGGGRPSRGN